MSLRILSQVSLRSRALRPVVARPAFPTKSLFYSTKTSSAPQIAEAIAQSPALANAKEKAAPKVGKLKELAQKYGAAGVLVYLGIGAVDLGVTFAAIQLAGQDKVKQLERGVMDTLREAKSRVLGERREQYQQQLQVQEVEKKQPEEDDNQPSLASVFILAYGIHKTLLLPVRLTITAAITPAVVRKLHAWGITKYAPRLFGASVPKA